jgi:hypothetical protein
MDKEDAGKVELGMPENFASLLINYNNQMQSYAVEKTRACTALHCT